MTSSERVAIAALEDPTAKQDHVVFVLNFFDDLRGLTSESRR